MYILLASISLVTQFTVTVSYMCNKNNVGNEIYKTKDIMLNLNTPFSVTIQPNLSCVYQHVFVIIPVGRNYTFVTLQAHTQYKVIVVSYTKTYEYGKTFNSSNPAIMNLLQRTERTIHGYIGSNSVTPVSSTLLAVSSSGRAPIPGGCCLTCAMEIDPNIELSYDQGKSSLFFHRASQYYYPTGARALCDDSENPGTYSLRYTVYYCYIKDFSSESLFDAIWKMSNPEKIMKYGISLSEITGRHPLKLTLQPIKGQGVVFNVIVYDPASKVSSAYIPVSSYHCHFTGPNADCYIKKDVTSIVYSVLCAVIGIVICFAGFKLLNLLLFISGWLFYWLFIYVTLYRYFIKNVNDLSRCDATERDVMIMSSMCAICGGAITLFFYAFQRSIVICFLTVSIVTGMFMTSILFYTPVGHLSFWDGDDKFIFAFCCISICVATFFFFVPKFLCIFSSSVIGSYSVILVPNYFFNGSLQYIVLVAVLRMSSSPDFFLERPYQLVDCILSIVWGLLSIIGIIIQYCTSRDENLELSGLYFTHNPCSRITDSSRGNLSSLQNSESSDLLGLSHSRHAPNEQTPLFHNTGESERILSYNNRSLDGTTSSFNQPNVSHNMGAAPSAPIQRSSSPPPPYTP